MEYINPVYAKSLFLEQYADKVGKFDTLDLSASVPYEMQWYHKGGYALFTLNHATKEWFQTGQRWYNEK